jgi:CheY-like chemotaxis protein
MPSGSVLVVEDDDSIRLLLMEYLKEDSALQVDGARDGVDALHHVSTRSYSVVILDLMMPYMTGIDFLDSLQVLASDPSVKTLEQPPAVIVVTSAPPEHIANSELERRFPSFVRAVLRKPVQAEELRAALQRLLG